MTFDGTIHKARRAKRNYNCRGPAIGANGFPNGDPCPNEIKSGDYYLDLADNEYGVAGHYRLCLSCARRKGYQIAPIFMRPAKLAVERGDSITLEGNSNQTIGQVLGRKASGPSE